MLIKDLKNEQFEYDKVVVSEDNSTKKWIIENKGRKICDIFETKKEAELWAKKISKEVIVITTESQFLKRTKEDIDDLIKEIKDNKGSILINNNFQIRFDYIDDPDVREVCRGFFITINPYNRDGVGISIKFDPYDNRICSGLVEVFEENGKK